MEFKCDNCGHIDTEETLVGEIKHYCERVDVGGPEPSGECSRCGALSYEIERA